MATGSPTPTHPLVGCVEVMEAALAKVNGADGVPVPDPGYLSEDTLADYLVRLDGVATQVAALKAAALAGGVELARRDGFRDPGAWLAAATRTTPGEGRGAFKLGTRAARRPATAHAWATGQITTAHAAAVLDAVDRLPVAEVGGGEDRPD